MDSKFKDILKTSAKWRGTEQTKHGQKTGNSNLFLYVRLGDYTSVLPSS